MATASSEKRPMPAPDGLAASGTRVRQLGHESREAAYDGSQYYDNLSATTLSTVALILPIESGDGCRTPTRTKLHTDQRVSLLPVRIFAPASRPYPSTRLLN